MTVIAALVHEDRVYMAADSQNNVYERPLPGAARKIHRLTTSSRDELLLGVCGDGALMVLIRDRLHVQATPVDDADPQPWADAVAIALTELAVEASVRNSEGRMDGTALLGWNGQLWALTHMQAIPHPTGIAAVGSGSDFAIATFEALRAQPVSATSKIRRAVEIACLHDVHCGGPIQLEELAAIPAG